MRNLPLCLLLAILTSCIKEKKQNIVIDTSIAIFVENGLGENLLLSSTQNSINTDDIRLLYLINGVTSTPYNPNMDCPRNVCLLNSDIGSERIIITPNDTESEVYPITYLNWGNGDYDTIKCYFRRIDNDNDHLLLCDTVWYNNLRVFPDSAILDYGRAFKTVK